MKRLSDLARLEPARLYSILTAVVVLVVAFGVHLDDDKRKAIDGLLVVILLGGGQAVRSSVTPNPNVSNEYHRRRRVARARARSTFIEEP